ncbi:hypothetical protein EV702DRAFT_1150116 [Suillus placidus]|uniref:Uncharacterized protein n=1 Tax=Suillus placidus TaxID=48579 RepID=A0A9P6ZIL0_9AGAM|nr:hypothetical protein EV702DRAFT_1150116 [Suillus placidus]
MRQEHISIAGLPHVYCRPSPPSFNPDATLFPTQIPFPHPFSSRFLKLASYRFLFASQSLSRRKRQNPILSFWSFPVFLFLHLQHSLTTWWYPIYFLILSVLLFYFAASQDRSIPNFSFYHIPSALASSPFLFLQSSVHFAALQSIRTHSRVIIIFLQSSTVGNSVLQHGSNAIPCILVMYLILRIFCPGCPRPASQP